MRRKEYLEPMVLAAIEAKRSLPRQVRPASQAPSLEERYFEGVRNSIEDMAAVRASEAIVSQVKVRFAAASDADIEEAIAAANTLQVCGLLAESEFGDSEGAVEHLEQEVPGFSRRLYQDVISYFGYINH